MLGRTDSRRRLLFLLICFAIGTGGLLTRLGYWQVVERGRLTREALAQATIRTETPSRRGEIYDRTGTVVLATSVQRDRLTAAPKQMTPQARERNATALSTILGLDVKAAAALRERLDSDKAYVVVAHDLAPESSAQVRAGLANASLSNVALEPEPRRVYPQAGGGTGSSLAAHVLGFVNRDGTGQYGIEQRYQAELGGSPRVAVADRDANGQPIASTETVTDEGAPGSDVTLTIDAGLQLKLEQELMAAWIADRAKNVSALVMDPHTGEIYAEATYPSYDANDYQQIASTEPSRFIDPMVSTVYEPGSVFKMFTAAAALGNGTVTTSTKIKDVGTLRLDGGRTKIDDADRKGRGWMTFEDGVAYSRNVIAAKVALALAPTLKTSSTRLYETWLQFGLGKPTGIDVAGEVNGLVRDPGIRPWREIDLANGSFGQGVAITPIQLATGFAAMMNGGVLIQPHVVKAVGEREQPVAVKGRIISQDLSETLVTLMNHVVSEVPFYRGRTLVPGYDVGGKTGTAQIWDPAANHGRGGWKHNKFNYSFVGYIGHQKGKPELVVAIRIEEGTPTVLRVGQIEMPVMSFELFRRIAEDAIRTPDLLAGGSSARPAPSAPDQRIDLTAAGTTTTDR
ncbi:MAG: peptidoglycan D,D-transpeptidase FtsI family protein [Chloroflexota bacterium]